MRIDERAAAFTALGLAKASRRPGRGACVTSGTAAANFHPAIIEADESGVPLLVLTADRPPELRGTGANQTIDQVKLYGDAVRWYADPGVPRAPRGRRRRLAVPGLPGVRAGVRETGTFPGPVHLNLPFRDPLVPGPVVPGKDAGLAGTPGRAPRWRPVDEGRGAAATPRALELAWAERGLVVCGDGDYDPEPLLELARAAGWPVLAEPSSNARRGPNALTGYQYLLACPEFMAAHRPEVIISAGRPGLSRPQSALLGLASPWRRRRSGTSSSRKGPAAGRTRSAPRQTSRRPSG